MTIHHRKESPATLDTLRFEVRSENSIPTTTPLGKLLPRLSVMMDCTAIGSECCCMFVWVMGGL